jgi:hypothetical protein
VARLTADGVARARQGKKLERADFAELREDATGAPSAWLGPGGDLVAVGVAQADGAFLVLRGFREVAT